MNISKSDLQDMYNKYRLLGDTNVAIVDLARLVYKADSFTKYDAFALLHYDISQNTITVIIEDKVSGLNMSLSAYSILNWAHEISNNSKLSYDESINMRLIGSSTVFLDSTFKQLEFNELDLSMLNISNVESTSNAFYCTLLNKLILPKYGASKIRDTSFMFQQAKIKSIENFNIITTELYNATKMFEESTIKCSLDLTSLGVSNKFKNTSMFEFCKVSGIIDISTWEFEDYIDIDLFNSHHGPHKILVSNPRIKEYLIKEQGYSIDEQYAINQGHLSIENIPSDEILLLTSH